MTAQVKKSAPIILEEIKKAQKILLHFHPSPDPDTGGSSLGLMQALKNIDKDVMVIAGDSQTPTWVSSLPGSDRILKKSYPEINPNEFDLFIIMDSSTKEMISNKKEVKFPASMTTVVIDHHISNQGFGRINLVDANYVATCQIIHDLLLEWDLEITSDIAACLFLGMYTDSGGFQYKPTDKNTFLAAADLARANKDLPKVIFNFENNNEAGRIKYQGLALSNIETYFKNHLALSAISLKMLKDHGIEETYTHKANIANILKSVIGWDLGVSMVEMEPGVCNVSFRTRDSEKFDLSKISMALDGGGHKAAAGASIKKPFDEAKKYLLEKIAEVYSNLGES